MKNLEFALLEKTPPSYEELAWELKWLSEAVSELNERVGPEWLVHILQAIADRGEAYAEAALKAVDEEDDEPCGDDDEEEVEEPKERLQ